MGEKKKNTEMPTLESMLVKQYPIQEIRLNSKRTRTKALPDDIRSQMNKEKIPITKNGEIKLYLPIIGAGMDTVTAGFDIRAKYKGGINYDALIILDQNGAIGTIPRSEDIFPKVQKKIIAGVKKATSPIVKGPYTVKPDDLLEVVQQYNREYGYSGYPVIDEDGKVVGIITKRDFENRDPMTLIKDRMSKKPHTVLDVDVKTPEEADTWLDKYRHSRLPVVNKEGILVGLLTRKDVDNRRFNPYATLDSSGRYAVLVAVGTNKDEDELKLLNDADGFIVDASIGRHELVFEKVEWLKSRTDKPVIAGNAMGKHDAEALAEIADAVKMGYGSGAGCQSSTVCGIGVSVANAIKEGYDACFDKGVPVWGDGGFKNSGDLTVGYALGANAIMLGRMLTFGEETPIVELRNIHGYPEKVYRGMGSEALIEKSHRYSSKAPEGTESWVQIKGPLQRIINDIEKGVYAGISGLGFSSVQEIIRNPDIIFGLEPESVSGPKNLQSLKTVPRNLNIN